MYQNKEDLRLSTMHTGAKALALLVGSALALSACATCSDESGDTESSGGTAAATIKLQLS